MFGSDRLINRCAAIESFDRVRRATSQSRFRTRVQECVELAGAPSAEVVPSLDEWLEALKARRDHPAHHLVSDDADSGLVDVVLADSVRLLFTLCFLREADTPPGVFDHLGAHPQTRWLARRVPEALAMA